MASFHHNKKRNSALVYEFLVRRLSRAMIDRNQADYRKALEITRKYYGEGTVLAEEKELFDVIRNTRGLTEPAARRVLGEIMRVGGKLDHNKIDIKKSNLIKEINYTFGKNFFSEHRIPDYRLLATIQMVLDSCQGQKALTESVQQIQLEEVLVSHMTSAEEVAVVAPKDPIDNVVLVMAARRFNERYAAALNKNQKVLMEKYIRSLATGDEFPLFQYIVEEVARINASIAKAEKLPLILEDKEMHGRLSEAKARFTEIAAKENTSVSESLVEEILLFQKLAEEIDS